MPRVQMTKATRAALVALLIYLVTMFGLIIYKFLKDSL